jgi:hypothetical protein
VGWLPAPVTTTADVPALWQEPGMPGYTPDAWIGTGFPPVLAGLVRGSWAVRDLSRAPQPMPFPDALTSRPSAAWFDSIGLARRAGEPGGGFGEPLVALEGFTRPPGTRRARALMYFTSGSFGRDRAGLRVEVGDSLNGLAGESMNDTHTGVDPYGPMGRHRWGAQLRLQRGAHRIDANFAQRGVGASLRSGEEESVSSRSGRVGYTYLAERWGVRAVWERGFGSHESFAPFLLYSRRDASEERVRLESTHELRGARLAARLRWSGARVRRDVDPVFDLRDEQLWAGLGLSFPGREGTWIADLGAGRDRATDVTVLVPRVEFRVEEPAFVGAVAVERLVAPVWSDLAPGTSAFLQDTWAGRFEAAFGPAGQRASALALLGRTRDRAILARLPLEDLWLRFGHEREPELSTFGLLMVGGRWSGRTFGVGGDAYTLRLSPSAIQPQVDPDRGFRAFAEGRHRIFNGQLEVTLRLEGVGVGPRESESASPRRLPGYLTSNGSVSASFGEVVFTARMRNLEDVRREEPWIDLATGREALGPGRAFDLVLIARLFD